MSESNEAKRYKFEVIADNSGHWAGNAIRFATPQEAEASAIDLAGRWMLVREWRVVDCETEFVVELESAGS